MENKVLEKVVTEQQELSQRIERLQAFLDKVPSISENQIELLKVQLNAMEIYNHILIQRIFDLKNNVAKI